MQVKVYTKCARILGICSLAFSFSLSVSLSASLSLSRSLSISPSLCTRSIGVRTGQQWYAATARGLAVARRENKRLG